MSQNHEFGIYLAQANRRRCRLSSKKLQSLHRIDISKLKRVNPALVVAFKGCIPVTAPHRIPLFIGGERLRDASGKPYPHNCLPESRYTHAIRLFYLARDLDSKQRPRIISVCIFHGYFDLLHAISLNEHPDSALIRLIHKLSKVLLCPDFPKKMIFRSKNNLWEDSCIESEWTRLFFRLCDRLFERPFSLKEPKF